MADKRAYTWGIVTYATESEFSPLLQASKHWAYATHDKDFIVDDTGEIKPKETHTHIIVTFEQFKSFKQVRELVQSEQNTLAQPITNKDRNGADSVRGLFKYLIHEDEDPTIKYIYDKAHRHTDDDAYWERRIGKELEDLSDKDSFFEDLTSEDFSVAYMGRKYGRDFMKNYGRYLEYRRAVERERAEERAQESFDEVLAVFKELEIPVEEMPTIHKQFINYVRSRKGFYSTKKG